MKTYDVIRKHGEYEEGETREADPREVAHLIGKCLAEKQAKADKPLKNKAVK